MRSTDRTTSLERGWPASADATGTATDPAPETEPSVEYEVRTALDRGARAETGDRDARAETPRRPLPHQRRQEGWT